MSKFSNLLGYLAALTIPLFFFYAIYTVSVLLYTIPNQGAYAVSTPDNGSSQSKAVETASTDTDDTNTVTVSAEAGAKVFKKCKACHTDDEGGKDKIGPNLWGVFGREVATKDGFGFSDAMQQFSGKTWDLAMMDTFLKKPKDMVKGTAMAFAGIKSQDDRNNLIAYLAQKAGKPLSVADLGFSAGDVADAPDASAAEAVEEVAFLDMFSNPPVRTAADQAAVDARVAKLKLELVNVDYERSRYHPIHFPPMINDASNEECLVCHQEIMEAKPLEISPAGVPANETMAWYQTLATYEGAQQTFHYRHLQSDYAKQVMNMECTFCHKGNDPREETPDFLPGRTIYTAPATPEFTLRKMVNPSTTCLLCHGAMPDPEGIMGLDGPWHEIRADYEDEETLNGCLTCHGEYGFRTNRHNVDYLNAANIEDLATASSDVCLGCHGGRQWYRISYPYPRHPWPDMDEETPDWALSRPALSDPAHQLATPASE